METKEKKPYEPPTATRLDEKDLCEWCGLKKDPKCSRGILQASWSTFVVCPNLKKVEAEYSAEIALHPRGEDPRSEEQIEMVERYKRDICRGGE